MSRSSSDGTDFDSIIRQAQASVARSEANQNLRLPRINSMTGQFTSDSEEEEVEFQEVRQNYGHHEGEYSSYNKNTKRLEGNQHKRCSNGNDQQRVSGSFLKPNVAQDSYNNMDKKNQGLGSFPTLVDRDFFKNDSLQARDTDSNNDLQKKGFEYEKYLWTGNGTKKINQGNRKEPKGKSFMKNTSKISKAVKRKYTIQEMESDDEE
jgi:hypothetical protein